LSFVSKGSLRVTDERGTLIELITGEGTAPCAVGEVSFLMGIPEPYDVQARPNEESALLSISKASVNELMLSFPDQHDIILTNLLLQYGLTRDGEEAAGATQASRGEDAAAQMRDEIKVSFSWCN
jgi:hypothetical protein